MGEHIDLLIQHIGQLCTVPSHTGGPQRGRALGDLGLLEDAAIAVDDGAIVAVGPSGALSGAQLQDMAMISYAAYGHGYMVGQVFFALWVLPLGVLICRSKFIPRVFGVLFIIETACGLLAVAAHFLLGNASLESALLLPGTVAEMTFLLWLVFRGVSQSKLPAQQS